MRQMIPASLLLGIWIFIHVCYAQNLNGEAYQYLVLDLTMQKKTVVLVRFNDEMLKQQVLLSDVIFFQGSAQGPYIAKKVNGSWVTGNYLTDIDPVEIDAKLVPEASSFATISHDGKGIIWLTDSLTRDKLILTDLIMKTNYQIRAKTGELACPAWAPNNRSFVYYTAQPNSLDGYILCSMEIPDLGKQSLDAVEWQEHEITPPSMPTRMSSGRTNQPLWAPDSMKVFFEGRYDTWKSIFSVVNLDGTGLEPSPGPWITWSADMIHLYTFIITGNQEQGYAFTPAKVSLETGEAEIGDLSLVPKNATDFSWSLDGQYYVAYTTKNILLVNAKTGADRVIFDTAAYYPVLWSTFKE